ncbi:DUF962 domain-containing protein [Caulobacter sp. 17J80-11]|uniref:DUF962 domain-containing protein n=1 Tax=Caulobacter sp. 17J80-11 TaxID=2763502 RepID=UPI001653BC62|nr:DUF962 domain-containing protein [Caulobacter sp. 17J80-11]MBC6983115.1 DUF962 domain-containing protein [Caulobacter sp. 17J80-11]
MDIGLPKVDRYAEFWPIYLREHRRAETRLIHYAGTSTGLACLVVAIVTRQPWWLLAGLIASYGAAWISHALIERNKPASWQYFAWSFVSDFRMFGLALTGRLDDELRRHGVSN